MSVLAVNYKGRPFMRGVTENRAFLYALGLCAVAAFVSTMEIVPQFNESLMQLVPFPTGGFRRTILYILIADSFGALIWDRLMHFIFAR